MKSNNSTTTQEMFETTIANLKNSIAEIKRKMPTIEAYKGTEKYVCYYPETYITIGVDNEGKVAMQNQIFPQQFNGHTASRICNGVKNGHGQQPECIEIVKFYKGYIGWMLIQIESLQTTLNEILSLPINK
jgi:hypothetical protein